MSNHIGKLLIAYPGLPKKDFFHKSVIFLYQDSKDGTLGLVLNKKLDVSVKEICYDRGTLWPDGITRCYSGGPLSRSSVILVHTDDWTSANTMHINKTGYCVSSDDFMFEKMSMGNQPAYWRMCLGISGWQFGQLNLELDGKYPYKNENSWLTATPNDSIMFAHDGEEQWKKALEHSSHQMIDSYF